MKTRIKKTAKEVKEGLDDATRAIGKEANKATGINISHVVNPEASDHKEALKDAREKLGLGDNNQDNTELAGATQEEHHES